MGTFIAIAVLVVVVVAVALVVTRLEDTPKPKPKPEPKKQPEKRDFPVATPSGPKPGPTPSGVPGIAVEEMPVVGPQSRIVIVPDKPFKPKEDSMAELQLNAEQGFETGDGMTIVVEAKDLKGDPMPLVAVRGIIDLFTGSALATEPRHKMTDEQGVAKFRYTMQESDQVVGGSKLITAVIIVPGGPEVVLTPTVLADVRTETNINDPFFRGE